MNQKNRLIPLPPLINKRLREEIKDLFNEALQDADALKTCISCVNFYEESEGCNLANGARPPARVIAFGCEKWVEEEEKPEASKEMPKKMPPKEIPRGGIPDKAVDGVCIANGGGLRPTPKQIRRPHYDTFDDNTFDDDIPF